MVVGASIHTHTHTHASPEYLTDTQREGLSDLHRAIKGMLTFNLVAVDLCRRIFVRGRSRPLLRLPSHSLRTRLVLACQLRNLFVTHFCSALFTFFYFYFLVCVFRCCLFFLLSLLSGVRLFHLGRKTQTCLLVIYGAEFSFTWHFYGVVSGCFAVFASHPVVHVYARFIWATAFRSSS